MPTRMQEIQRGLTLFKEESSAHTAPHARMLPTKVRHSVLKLTSQASQPAGAHGGLTPLVEG